MITLQLEQGLAELGLRPPPEAADQLDRYAQLLLEKNQVMNLTAITEPGQVASLHMLDCAALLTLGELEGKTLVDVGTGAGFPGMVLKILSPSLDVTLLDSLAKRLDWLEEVREELGLTGIGTVHARAEEYAVKHRESFDVATSRAVAALPVLAELCLPLIKVGGVFLAMKSVDSEAELTRASGAIAKLGGTVERTVDYAIPGTDVRHRVIVIRKTGKTPEKYPRAFAKIKKSPLS